MTPRFILDENIIILAHKREDDHGNPDRSCLDLLEQIIEICYPLILDNSLWDKYNRQLGEPRNRSPHAPHVSLILNRALQREGKVEWQVDTPAFPEEASIPQGSQDDVENVRLAVLTLGTFVTTDSPLISDLETAGITQRYQLQVVTPNQAFNFL